MGIAFNKVTLRPAPFRSITEDVFVLPSAGGHVVRNRSFKLILFFRVAGFVRVDEDYEFALEDYDILLLPRPCRQKYFQNSPSAYGRTYSLVAAAEYPLAAPTPRRSRAGAAEVADPRAEFIETLRERFQAPLQFRGRKDPELWYIMTEIRQECEQDLPQREEKIQALLRLILARLAEQTAGRPGPAPASALVGRAQYLLMEHFPVVLTLAALARRLQVTREHLAREFRRHTGDTVSGFIRELRLERAKTLLVSSENSIAAIGQEVGFEHSSAFSRFFREAVGLAPHEYRMRASEHIVSQHILRK